jgi:stage IV sporulation protein A
MMERTQGDIYLGVVGPVRTGKSTFIKKFAELMMVPNIENEFERNRLVDELPQSGTGKTVMTTQPKFIPNDAVDVRLDETMTARMRLIDCVGYMVPGAIGSEEDGTPRMVSTPWFDEDIPFEQAAEIGTGKVITDHATVGIVVFTDGSITEIPRENYTEAENTCMEAVRKTGKPFVLILNSKDPGGDIAMHAAEDLEERFGIRPMIVDLLHLSERVITSILTEILYAFPLKMIGLNGPSFLGALSAEHPILTDMLNALSDCVGDVRSVRDARIVSERLSELDSFQSAEIDRIDLGTGRAFVDLRPKEGVFYSVLSDACGTNIRNDYELMSAINDFVKAKTEYDRLSDALNKAMQTGYGIVEPDQERMEIGKPELFRSGGKYGVRLHTRASGLHLIRVDVDNDIEPLIGTEQQSKDFLDYLSDASDTNGDDYLQTKLFGKTLYDLIREGMNGKGTAMNEDVQLKLKGAIQKIVNDGCNGMICIML